MDIDKQDESEASDYEEPEDDEEDREAPSEHDTDEAGGGGHDHNIEAHSEDESIHTQTSQRDFGASPLEARALDFAGSSQATGGEHVTSLAEEPRHGVESEGPHDEEDAGDADEHVAGESENDDLPVQDVEEGADEEVEADKEVDCEAAVEELVVKTVAEPLVDIATTSGRASPSLRQEIEDIPPKTKSSKRGKHKDRQSRRHSSRAQEPAITESFIEDKIVGVLSRTLPTMLSGALPTMLSGMLAEALSLARLPPQPAPLLTPTVEVAVQAAEPARVVDQGIVTHEVGGQGVDVDLVIGATPTDASPTDASPTTMDTSEATVSIRPS